MRVSTPGRINQACLELFDEPAEKAVPRLMDELEKPHRVASRLDVNTNAVRQWLQARGWRFNGEKWVAAEVEHAPSL